MTGKAPHLGKQKERVSDRLWLTPRCQTVVNRFNAGDLTEAQAVAELQAVGNTVDQAREVLELHRGRPAVKVKRAKKDDPLRRMKR